MAAASSLAGGEHTWSDDTPSGFLKFSAEIRNKIYRLTLVDESARFVVVEDMHPEQWHEAKEAGRGARTSYKTRDHDYDYIFCSYFCIDPEPQPCTCQDERWKNAKVSYTMQVSSFFTSPTIGMLALNRQTRAEAIPVFYGGNEIRFHSMSAIVPFLRDRSELSRQSMQDFHLVIQVIDGRSQASRQEGWARTFAEFANIGPLNLRNLTMRIFDPHCRYAWKLKLDTKMQRWVHEMAKNITNLDKLGVTFDFSIMGEMTPDKMVKEDSQTERLLWEFLAPKMLKKVGDEPHDARSLSKRRIRDDPYGSDFEEYEDEVVS